MIIKLTEKRKDGEWAVHVNMDHVQYFSKSMNGNDTRLKIAGDNIYLFVKESVEEINELMSVKMLVGDIDLTDVEMGLPRHIVNGAR